MNTSRKLPSIGTSTHIIKNQDLFIIFCKSASKVSSIAKRKKKTEKSSISTLRKSESKSVKIEQPDYLRTIVTATTSSLSDENVTNDKGEGKASLSASEPKEQTAAGKNIQSLVHTKKEGHQAILEGIPKSKRLRVRDQERYEHKRKPSKIVKPLPQPTSAKSRSTLTFQDSNHQRENRSGPRKSKSQAKHSSATKSSIKRISSFEGRANKAQILGGVAKSKSLTTGSIQFHPAASKSSSTTKETKPRRSKSSESQRPHSSGKTFNSSNLAGLSFLELVARENSSVTEHPKKSTSTSKHRSIRLDFDGKIKESSLQTSNCHANKTADCPKSNLNDSQATNRLKSLSSSTTHTANSSDSSHFRSTPHSNISDEITHHRRKIKKKTRILSAMEPNDEQLELFPTNPENVEMSIENPKSSSTSCMKSRKCVIFGSIVCALIVIAAIVVPCVLFLGDSGGAAFPELQNAPSGRVVAGIPNNICHEGIPKTGTCTPPDSEEDKQGSEFCNLVAKSMINTTIYGDVALLNAGVCKQGLTAPEVTAGDIKSAVSMENLVSVEMSGYDISTILQEAATASFGASGNPDSYPYAAGLRYNVEANKKASERISNIQVNRRVGSDQWEPLDVRKFYTVITTKSLANGKMGYHSFQDVVADWKDPLTIDVGDAFYNYAMKNAEDPNWSVLPNSEYSTQLFIGESEEPTFALVPTRLCHALIPGQPVTDSCTPADVANGGQVCSLAALAIYDQNFGIDIALLRGSACRGNIEEGKLGESDVVGALSENEYLVTADLLGSQIVSLLEGTVTAAVDGIATGEYPYAGGLRFDVNRSASPKVSNIETMSSNGSWVPIVPTQTYKVAMAADTSDSFESTDMGVAIKDEIIQYAEEWGTIYTPPKEKISTQSFI